MPKRPRQPSCPVCRTLRTGKFTNRGKLCEDCSRPGVTNAWYWLVTVRELEFSSKLFALVFPILLLFGSWFIEEWMSFISGFVVPFCMWFFNVFWLFPKKGIRIRIGKSQLLTDAMDSLLIAKMNPETEEDRPRRKPLLYPSGLPKVSPRIPYPGAIRRYGNKTNI